MSWSEALFRPQRVAVVGSVGDGKIGRVLVDSLLDGGFTDVVAVNPRGEGVRGIPAVASLSDLPPDDLSVDLVVVASPAATVPDVLHDAGRAGVKTAVVITAGFSETGNVQGEVEILAAARQAGVRVVGPNCAGIANTHHDLFATLETHPPAGEVAFVSQSGALGGAVLSWAEEQGVGISTFVSYGNAADLTEVDFLDALREDDDTRVVALYLETVSNGRRFMDAAARLAAVKPLVVIKSGRSESGGRATQSHTGSLAGADAVYDAALAQCGAIRVSGVEEMFDVCRGFVHLPVPRGRRVAVVTNSGGPGVLAADAGEDAGLSLDAPGPTVLARLRDRLSPVCSLSNPFDLTVQATEDDYHAALEAVLSEYDAAVAINVNTPYLDVTPLARGVVAAARTSGKPIAASFVAGRPAEAALPVLADGGVPNFTTGERAMRVLARMSPPPADRANGDSTESGGWQLTPTSAPQPLPWSRRPTEPEAMAWLRSLDLPVVDHTVARSAEQAVAAARDLNGPVALKVVSAAILHKSDCGGVALNVATEAGVRAAFRRMAALPPKGSFEGVVVSRMIQNPVEAIVGLTTDAQFGPVIAVGLGGIFTEMFRDVVLRVAPVKDEEARRMIEELRGIGVLRGARGSVLRDVGALARLVSRISRLPFEFAGLDELDLNPVFLFERGCAAGDARILRVSDRSDGRSD